MLPESRIAKFFRVSETEYKAMGDLGLAYFGRIVRSHGVRGEVKMDLSIFLSEEDITRPIDSALVFCDASGKSYENIEYLHCYGDRAIAKLRGVNSRDQARKSVGLGFFVRFGDIKPEFLDYYGVVGCEVLLMHDGSRYGTVVGCCNFGGGALLEVYSDKIKDTAYFLRHLFSDFDPDKRSISLTMPEYMG